MKPSQSNISDAITYTLGQYQGRGWMTDPFLCRDMLIRLSEILRLVSKPESQYWCPMNEIHHLHMIHDILTEHETKVIAKEMGTDNTPF